MAIFDPVGFSIAEISVEEDKCPSLTHFAYIEQDIVISLIMPAFHSGGCPSTFAQRSTSDGYSSQRISGRPLVSSQASWRDSAPKWLVGTNCEGSSKLPTVKSQRTASGYSKPRGVPHWRQKGRRAIGAAMIPVGLTFPDPLIFAHIHKRDRNPTCRALTHPAVAEIGIIVFKRCCIANAPALASAPEHKNHAGLFRPSCSIRHTTISSLS